MRKLIPTSGLKWIDAKDVYLNECTNNTSKVCVVEDDLEYQKELRQWHNNYPLAPNKTEIKREMLSKYQLMIAEFMQWSYW